MASTLRQRLVCLLKGHEPRLWLDKNAAGRTLANMQAPYVRILYGSMEGGDVEFQLAICNRCSEPVTCYVVVTRHD